MDLTDDDFDRINDAETLLDQLCPVEPNVVYEVVFDELPGGRYGAASRDLRTVRLSAVMPEDRFLEVLAHEVVHLMSPLLTAAEKARLIAGLPPPGDDVEVADEEEDLAHRVGRWIATRAEGKPIAVPEPEAASLLQQIYAGDLWRRRAPHHADYQRAYRDTETGRDAIELARQRVRTVCPDPPVTLEFVPGMVPVIAMDGDPLELDAYRDPETRTITVSTLDHMFPDRVCAAAATEALDFVYALLTDAEKQTLTKDLPHRTHLSLEEDVQWWFVSRCRHHLAGAEDPDEPVSAETQAIIEAVSDGTVWRERAERRGLWWKLSGAFRGFR